MITKLIDKQKEATKLYRELGIKIGFSTHDEESFNPELIKELTDKHRVMCGIPAAKNLYVADSPFKVVKQVSSLSMSDSLAGNLDIHWLNFYNYFRVELGLVEQTEKIVHLLELTKYVGYMWMNTDSTIITKKPTKIVTYTGDASFVDVDGKEGTYKTPILHNLTGPSIEYLDGYKLYHLWGRSIPEDLEWIVTDTELDVKKVMRIPNTDIRTLALKKIGVEKAFDNIDKEVLHTKTFLVGGDYTLYSVDFGGDTREVYLKMQCPSKKSVHIEGVHPDCKTVDQALGYSMFEDGWEDPNFVYIEPLVQS